MPSMKNARLSLSFCSFFLSSDMRIICIPHVPIVNPKTTLEWGFQNTHTHNHTYLAPYKVDTPHTNCIISYALAWVCLNIGNTPNPRVKSSRSLLKLLSSFSDQCGGLTNGTQKNTKANPGTRATPMTHRMVGKIWKFAAAQVGKATALSWALARTIFYHWCVLRFLKSFWSKLLF